MKRLLAVFILLVTLRPAGLAAAEPLAVLPYRIDYEGWVTVDIRVNDQGPYDFIVDTGATRSMIFANLAALQDFPPSDQPPRRILGLSTAGKLPMNEIGVLGFGGESFPDLATVILADWEAPRRTPQGVLGLDFLTRYLVVFDNERREMHLYDPAHPPNAEVKAWRRARLKPDDFGLDGGTLYTVNCRVQGTPIRFILDLGASGTLMNKNGLAALFRGVITAQIRPPGVKTGTRIKDAFDVSERAKLLQVRRLQMGGVYWKRRVVIVFDAPIFEELGVDRQAFGLLGADLFINRSFALDFRRGWIYVSKPQKPGRERTQASEPASRTFMQNTVKKSG